MSISLKYIKTYVNTDNVNKSKIYIKTYVNTDNVNKSKIYQNVRKY